MKVLVPGAGGLLATAVAAAVREAGAELVETVRADLDITDADAVARVLEREQPDLVINCAAWSDVDGAERARTEALAINASGARNLAAAAAAIGAAIVYPSSDYVFDGTKQGPYIESDPENPISVYGETKVAGEAGTAASNERHFIVRSAWLYGPGGDNFVETIIRRTLAGAELRIVDDQVGCPTYTRQLAAALVVLGASEDYGIHHVAGGGSCSWHEFAVAILAGAGIDHPVAPCASSEFPRPAPRPTNSVLRSERDGTPRLPDWRDGLAAYLAERRAAPA